MFLVVVKLWVFPIPVVVSNITLSKSEPIPVLVVTIPIRLLSKVWTKTSGGRGLLNPVLTRFIASVWYVNDVPAPGL